MKNKELYHISLKSFLSVIFILLSFILITGILIYIIPAGSFDESGIYHRIETGKYPILKIIFAPFYMLTNKQDLMGFLGLTSFIIFISGAFQVMKDSNGMNVLIRKLVSKFEKRRFLLIMIITLFFMSFGSFFGVFEEVIILVPLVVGLSISLGWDTLTGLGMSLLSIGLGFGVAITNPFSVGVASSIIGVSPLSGILYRIIIFVITYVILVLFLYRYTKKIEKDKEKSLSFEIDQKKLQEESLINLSTEKIENEKKISLIYTIFFIGALITLICAYTISFLNGLSVIILALYFLIGGIICGFLIFKDKKDLFKSLKVGYKSALPAILMILLSLSVKFLIMDSMIAETITFYFVNVLKNTGSYFGIILIFLIIIILEFFISSSTAKAVLVMGILGSISIYTGLSKNSLVLAYIMGDGFTNIIFPTSPVLLISLSIAGLRLKTWYKWVKWLILLLMILNIIYLLLAVMFNY